MKLKLLVFFLLPGGLVELTWLFVEQKWKAVSFSLFFFYSDHLSRQLQFYCNIFDLFSWKLGILRWILPKTKMLNSVYDFQTVSHSIKTFVLFQDSILHKNNQPNLWIKNKNQTESGLKCTTWDWIWRLLSPGRSTGRQSHKQRCANPKAGSEEHEEVQTPAAPSGTRTETNQNTNCTAYKSSCQSLQVWRKWT